MDNAALKPDRIAARAESAMPASSVEACVVGGRCTAQAQSVLEGETRWQCTVSYGPFSGFTGLPSQRRVWGTGARTRKTGGDRIGCDYGPAGSWRCPRSAGDHAGTGPTAPADDLPAEFRLLLGTDSGHDYRWTLIGKNEKAQEQEKLHPELNAIHAIWHFPLATRPKRLQVRVYAPDPEGRQCLPRLRQGRRRREDGTKTRGHPQRRGLHVHGDRRRPESRQHQAGRFRSGWQDPPRRLQHRDSGGNALSGRRNGAAAARRAFRIRVLRVVVRQGQRPQCRPGRIAVLPPRRRRRLPTPGSWSIPT